MRAFGCHRCLACSPVSLSMRKGAPPALALPAHLCPTCPLVPCPHSCAGVLPALALPAGANSAARDAAVRGVRAESQGRPKVGCRAGSRSQAVGPCHKNGMTQHSHVQMVLVPHNTPAERLSASFPVACMPPRLSCHAQGTHAAVRQLQPAARLADRPPGQPDRALTRRSECNAAGPFEGRLGVGPRHAGQQDPPRDGRGSNGRLGCGGRRRGGGGGSRGGDGGRHGVAGGGRGGAGAWPRFHHFAVEPQGQPLCTQHRARTLERLSDRQIDRPTIRGGGTITCS